MSTDETTRGVTFCKRHPSTETRLGCTACGDPICPDCMVVSPVGQKCPDCGRLSRSERQTARPDQFRGALLQGGGMALAVAAGLGLIIFRVGFFSLIGTGFGGYYIAEAVRKGAQGNRADAFRIMGYVLTVVAVALGWVVFGTVGGRSFASTVTLVTRNPYALLTFAAGAYGAWRSLG